MTESGPTFVESIVTSADIGTAYSDFAKAESDWQLAQRSFQLASELYQVKAIPQKEFEQAENDFMKTQAEYQRARGRLRVLKVSERELDKPPDQRKLTARFDVKAPLDGIIVDKSVTVGQLVEPDKTLYTIANPDMLQAVGEIYERDLRLVKPGMAASVRIESLPAQPFPAVIAYIGDVVDALVRLMATPEALGQVYNLGSDEEVSINELAERVIRISGSSSKVQHITYEQAYGQRFDDMPRRVPRLDRIRSVIPFSPKLKLDQIIASVVEEKKNQPR